MSTLSAFFDDAKDLPQGFAIQDLDEAIGEVGPEEFFDACSGPFLLETTPGVLDPDKDQAAGRALVAGRLTQVRESSDVGTLRVHSLHGVAPGAEGAEEGVTIGSLGSEATIQIAGDTVSQLHCRLLREERLEVQDKGAANGTFVEERQISSASPVPLRSGMCLRLGEQRVLILSAGHLYAILRKTDWDVDAPLAEVAGIGVPAEGLAFRDLVPALAKVDSKSFVEGCSFGFLLEMPTERTKEARATLGRPTLRLEREDVLSLKRAKKAGRARIHPLVSRRPEAGKIVIGRNPFRCDVVIPDSAASSTHAEIRDTGEGWLLVDLGSGNGTLVDGKPIEAGDAQHMNVRQAIWFGSYRTILLDSAAVYALAKKMGGF
ncbi:MAG: FHA domain-containing protein [Planctomycetes bacterium]|nr:FHA domain-containing protein [Planctomycetota bacterium]